MINLLELKRTTQFKKDLKRVMKRGFQINELESVIIKLRKQETLEPKYFDHALTGNFKGFRECHIMPDWLLMYKVEKKKLILTVLRTVSHSDLFE